MKVLYIDVVMQEVPDEVSLALSITGCPNRCEGCHTPELRNPSLGDEFTDKILTDLLDKYDGLISCVLFFGGDHLEEELIHKLKIVRKRGYKTCLYTGNDDASDAIKSHLDYIKVGPYIANKGSLFSKKTNQRMYNLIDGKIIDITYKFQL